MSDTIFLKRFSASGIPWLIKVLFLLALLATSHFGAKAQNFTKPNIEGPSGLQVNSYTGSLFTQRMDMVIPGRELSLDVTFSYNSSAREQDFGFGYGWTLSWNQFYQRDSSGEGITFYRNDGRKDHYLRLANSWTAPKGIFDILTEVEPDKFLLTAKSGTQYFFESSIHKKLTRVKDRNGNQITLAYSGSNLALLTDASGRTISFSWADGHLSQVRSDIATPAHVVSYQYNKAGCLVSVKDPLGNVTSYSYGAARMMTALTTPNRFTTNIAYYSQGAVSKLVSCQLEQSITYNTAQLKVYVIEKGQGKTVSTTYAFDGEGRLIERTGNCCGFKNLYGYDQDNNIAFITNANGNATRYAYDKRGNPIAETDPLGHSTVYTYEPAFNQVTSVTDKSGNKTYLKYDDRGNLVEATDPMGIVTRYTYDGFGNRLTSTNGKGVVTAWTYDDYGSIASMTDGAGSIDSYSYDAWGNLLSQTDALSHKTLLVYDATNRLLSITDALGGQTRYTYDANGNRLTVIDPRGNTTALRYDENDRPVSATDALGKVTVMEYDAFGNITAGIDANGYATRNTYDNLNRLVSSTNAAGESTSFTYDGNGNRVSVTAPNGNTIRFSYDALNRVIETNDKSGLLSAVEYDGNGNRKSVRDANGHTTSYKYDVLNRPVSVADAAGNAATYTYDATGNLIKETDRNNQATLYAYDLVDRRVSSTDALGNVTKYAWDKLDNMLSITDAKGNPTSYSYDALSRKTQERFADNSTKAFTYDAAGNLMTRKDNKGVVTEYHYDAQNRMTSRLYPSTTESFTYDAIGRMLSAKNVNATIAFAYDPVGRLSSETSNGKTSSYAYDVAAGAKTITYPGGRIIRREMDSRNQLKTIKEGASSLAEFAYDAAGQMMSRKYANNTSTTMTYDGTGRITGLTGNPSRFVDLGYSYDKNGNPQAAQFKHLPAGSESYRYDALGQVMGFQKGAAPQSVFNFDAVGNRTTTQINGAAVSYTVNEMNAYTSAGATSFSYDGNGNLTADGRNAYSYDFENRMIAVNSGAKASYLYDALGRRIKKIVGADTVNYFYDGQQVIEERNGSDSVQATYVWGSWIDDVVSMSRKGASYFYHTNTIGSVTSITNAAGAVVERYDYDSWGKLSLFNSNYEPLSISTIGNAYTYTGQRIEWETGFYFYRSRNYDPEHARFVQRDPLGYVDGLGLYAYVSNQPMTMVDPFGTEGINYCLDRERAHDALAALGFIPGYGAIFDLINARLYFEEGDNLNASLSVLSAIPGIGDAFAAGRLALRAGKIAKFSENAFEITRATPISKFLENSFDIANRLNNQAIEIARRYKIYRPQYGKGQLDEVWESAKRANGKVYDPNSGRELTWDKSSSRNGQWDMGHRPEFKYETQLDLLRKGKITEEQFLENYRNSKSYRPEGVYENRSRKYDPKK